MPVRLQVRTQIQAHQNSQVFEDRLRTQLSTGQVDGKQKLDDLRAYMQNKGANAKIRVVNTTRDAELAFQFKSFGYQPYRQERTAGALKELLVQAGTDPEVATRVVHRVLKNGNHYRTATKAMVSQILNDPDVQRAIAPVPADLVPAAAAEPDHPVVDLPQPPATHHTAGEILNLIAGEFQTPEDVKDMGAGDPAELEFFQFKHATGADAHFHNLSNNPDAEIMIKKGIIFYEEDLFLGEAHQPADDQQQPFKYLLQQKLNGQVVGPPLLLSREELQANLAFDDQDFRVLGVLTSDQPIADGQAEEASAAAAKNLVFHVSRNTKAATLDQFLQAQGMHIGPKLGKGAFGSVKSLGAVPGRSAQVVKYLENRGGLKPETLSAVRNTRSLNEAYAAYLVTSRDPQWVKPKVVAPSHYLVGQPSPFQAGVTELKLVPVNALKQTIRENAKKGHDDLRCYGMVMDKAPGDELAKQIKTLAQNPNQRAIATKSGLETLKSLNTRGFVHRDIKPANLIFNGQELHFIDTGMLFKIRKTADDKPQEKTNPLPPGVDRRRIHQLPRLEGGSRMYMHKDLAYGQRGYIGTQADLHAFGLVTLEMEAPEACYAIFNAWEKESRGGGYIPISPDTFMQSLDTVIASPTLKPTVKASAIALRENMANPNHLANLGFECMRKADTSMAGYSAARWADRQFSDQEYAQLLSHPSLAVVKGVTA